MNVSKHRKNACSCNVGIASLWRGSSSSSLFFMRAIALFCALSAISLGALCAPPKVCAATWPVTTSALSASCAFHESYSAGDTCYVHSGIDIPASAGMQISAPLAGTVRFTGTVPSGDSRISGGALQSTMKAVTIEVQEGMAITLMPFDSITVQEGQVVAEGMSLGTLAAGGDISTVGAHVHMGYKRGREYFDPLLLFGISSASSQDRESGIDSLAVSTPGASMVLGGAPSVDAALQGEGLLGSSEGLTQKEALTSTFSAEKPSFGTIETGSYAGGLAHESAASFSTAMLGAVEPLLAACAIQLDSLAEGLSSIADALHVPLPVIMGVAAVSVVAAVALMLVAAIKYLLPRVSHVLRAMQSDATCQRS